MQNLTFKQYVSIVNEDIDQEVQKLQSDISMIDASIQARTAPLIQRKNQLQKLLAIKTKQQQEEQKKTANSNGNNAQTPQAGTPGSMTATPGSSGAQTPGSGAAQ